MIPIFLLKKTVATMFPFRLPAYCQIKCLFDFPLQYPMFLPVA